MVSLFAGHANASDDAHRFRRYNAGFLARTVRTTTELETVEAKDNGVVTPWAARTLANALKAESCRLRRLLLNGTKLRVEGFVPLFEALRHHPTLACLEVARGDLCESYVGRNRDRSLGACEACAAMLSLNKKLEELRLDANDLRDDGCAVICEALPKNRSLRVLGLRANDLERISPSGALARAVERNATLEALDLGKNPLTREGPSALATLADACAGNLGLRRLDLSGSGVDDAPGPRMAFLEPAAVAIARCLDANPRLRTVRL